MPQNSRKIQRQQEWNNDPKAIAFRQALAMAKRYAEAITSENMTETLVDRLADVIAALWNDDINNSQIGYEEFTPEINYLDDLLAALDHELAQERRRRKPAA